MENTRNTTATMDTSDNAVLDLLRRLKATIDQDEIRQLSYQLELVIFHKHYANG